MIAPLTCAASYSATDLNKCGGQILDTAATKGAVRITRRGQDFILMRGEQLSGLLEAARDGRPQSLADLLCDYDAAKIKGLTAAFLNDAPAGRETL